MTDTERFEFEGYDVYVVVDEDGNRTVIDPVEELTQMSRQIGELETCRRLLREICDQQKNNHTWLGTVAGQEWLEAAKAAGGE
jgi:hypothetical protein